MLSSSRGSFAVWVALLVCLGGCGVEVVEQGSGTPTPIESDKRGEAPQGNTPAPEEAGQDPSDGAPDEDALDGDSTQPLPPPVVTPDGLDPVFLPHESRKEIIVGAIRDAKREILAGLYLVTDNTITNALVSAAERGVTVRVVIDDSDNTRSANNVSMPKLTAAGAQVVKATGFVHHHAKYMLIDDELGFVMTCNFTNSSFTSNREVIVRVAEPRLLDELAIVFEADFAHADLTLPETQLVLSPDNSRERLSGMVSNAKQRVFVAMQYVDDNSMVYRFIAAKRAGVDVRVLIADPSRYGNHGDAQWLKDQGVAVKYLPLPMYLHEKVIVADDTAFVGSVNMSYTSLTSNREVGVVGDEAFTSTLMQGLEADWQSAVDY